MMINKNDTVFVLLSLAGGILFYVLMDMLVNNEDVVDTVSVLWDPDDDRHHITYTLSSPLPAGFESKWPKIILQGVVVPPVDDVTRSIINELRKFISTYEIDAISRTRLSMKSFPPLLETFPKTNSVLSGRLKGF